MQVDYKSITIDQRRNAKKHRIMLWKTLISGIFFLSSLESAPAAETEEIKEIYFEYKILDGKIANNGIKRSSFSFPHETEIFPTHIDTCIELCITKKSDFFPCLSVNHLHEQLKDFPKLKYETLYYKCVQSTIVKIGHFASEFREKELTEKSIRGLNDVESPTTTLILHAIGIIKIQEHAFDDARYLEVLELEYNDIEEIPRHTFDDTKSLVKLSLRNNKILSLHKKVFEGPAKLETIDLSENNLGNKNQIFFWDVFFPLYLCLRHLSLSNNGLTVISIGTTKPPLKDSEEEKLLSSSRTVLVELQTLDFSFNQILLTEDFYRLAPNVEVLNLSNNEFSMINGNPFKRLKYLRVLNLRDNKLTTAKIEWHNIPDRKDSDEPVELLLSGNPWKCGCENIKFYIYSKWVVEKVKDKERAKELLAHMQIKCQNGTVLDDAEMQRIKDTHNCGTPEDDFHDNSKTSTNNNPWISPDEYSSMIKILILFAICLGLRMLTEFFTAVTALQINRVNILQNQINNMRIQINNMQNQINNIQNAGGRVNRAFQ